MLEAIESLKDISATRPEKIRTQEEMGKKNFAAYQAMLRQFSILNRSGVTTERVGVLSSRIENYRKSCLEAQDVDTFVGIPGYHSDKPEESNKLPLVQLPSFFLMINRVETSLEDDDAIHLLDILWLSIPVGGIHVDELAQISDPETFANNPSKAKGNTKKIIESAELLLSGTSYPGKVTRTLDARSRAIGGSATIISIEKENKEGMNSGELTEYEWTLLTGMLINRSNYLTDLLKQDNVKKVSDLSKKIENSLQGLIPKSRPTADAARQQEERLYIKLINMFYNVEKLDAVPSYYNFLTYIAKLPERAELLSYLDQLHAKVYEHKNIEKPDQVDLWTGLEIFWTNAINRRQVLLVSEMKEQE